MKEPEVAAGDAGDCGDGLAVGEVGVVQGEAELAVKPPASRLPQRARWPCRPAPAARSVVPQSARIYFDHEMQDSESNILTPN